MPDSVAARARQRVIVAGLIAAGAGAVICLLMPVFAGAGWRPLPSLQLIAYMLAAISISGIVGFIFGVPRARTDVPVTADSPRRSRFEANSNLEQISDWLTKLLVGATLVQLAVVPAFLRKLGDYLGSPLGFAGSQPAAVAIVVYGAGIGFLALYLWARLRLRVLLEASEHLAEGEWDEVKPVVQAILQEAEVASGGGTSSEAARGVAKDLAQVDSIARVARGLAPILWVDDHPDSNRSPVRALRESGVRVVEVLTTERAMRELEKREFGLVITDLRRTEEGVLNPSAGMDLIAQVRQRDPASPPIIVYTSRAGVEHRAELLEAGARFVTSSPSELFREAMRALVGSSER